MFSQATATISDSGNREPQPTRKRVSRIVTRSLLVLGLIVSALFFGVSVWIRRNFGTISFDQLLMNTPGVGGGAVTDAIDGYVKSFLLQAALVPLLLLLTLCLFVWGVAVLWRRLTRKHPGSTATEATEATAVSAASVETATANHHQRDGEVAEAEAKANAEAVALPNAALESAETVGPEATTEPGPEPERAQAPTRGALPAQGGAMQTSTEKLFAGRRRMIPTAVVLTALISSVLLLSQTVGIDRLIRSVISPMNMQDYYAAPRIEPVVGLAGNTDGTQPLNLITIYLESVDDKFSDSDLFGEDLLSEVSEVTQNWQSIPRLETYVGGGWTMAGLVGSQCGVPLRGAGIGVNDINSNDIGAEASVFMPNAVCLGDVLQDAGYKNVFLGGADESFASKGDFLTSHGYDEVKGLKYWEEQNITDTGVWGVSDQSLMQLARDEVTALHASDQPFHLSLLTLDFHEPLHLYEYCDVTTDEPMASVLKCSMSEVAQFVTFLESSGVLEDTAVVIMADHPKMIAEGGAFWDELHGFENVQDRPLYNRVWSPQGLTVVSDSADQLSMYASLLDLVGLGAVDGRAGLGTSVFRSEIDETAATALPPNLYAELLESRSRQFYEQLWGVNDTLTAQTQG